MGAAAALEFCPYRDLLGSAFAALHPHVQHAHVAPLAASGTLDVEHGSHWVVPILVRAMALPRAGADQPATLEVTPAPAHVAWTRRIGDVELRTRQRARRGRLVEHHGAGCIVFRLREREGALEYEQVAVRAAGVPVPAAIAPRVTARVAPAVEGWTVNVTVTWRGALVCRYAGRIRAR